MEAPKMNELQIRLMAIAKCLEEVDARGKDNWRRLTTAVMELEKFANDVTGKKLVDEKNE